MNMTKTQHTPGPWEHAITDQYSQSVDIFESGNARTIARTVLNYPIKTQEANARLISAAPDLLEACKKAANSFKAQFMEGPIYKMLSDAITKAEGSL